MIVVRRDQHQPAAIDGVIVEYPRSHRRRVFPVFTVSRIASGESSDGVGEGWICHSIDLAGGSGGDAQRFGCVDDAKKSAVL
jgi:hypothetical protein